MDRLSASEYASVVTASGHEFKDRLKADATGSQALFPALLVTSSCAEMTTEFRASSEPLPHIPADVSIPQFILDSPQTTRLRESGTPLLVDDNTGRALKLDEVGVECSLSGDRLLISYLNRSDHEQTLWPTG